MTPRRIRAATYAVVASAWFGAVAFFVGAGSDHVADVRLLQRAYQDWLPVWGLDSPGDYYTQFHPQSVVDSYGYSFSYFSHIVTRLVSIVLHDDYGVYSELRVIVQNLLVAAVGFVGCIIVGRIVRVVTGSPHGELLGFVLMAVMPLWVGHSWMNQKDVPFATGFTACALVGVCGLARSRWNRLGSRFVLSPREESLWLALGIVLTFGTRPGIAPLVIPLLALVFLSEHGLRFPPRVVLGGIVTGVTVTLATNPASLPNPVGWLISAVRAGRNFSGWSGDVLFFGKFVSGRDFGARRLFIEYFFQGPLLMWFGVAAAVVAAGALRGRMPRTVLPIVYQGVVIPCVVFGLSQNNYNAGRQYLFVLPGLVATSALGLWFLHQRCRGQVREALRAIAVLLCVALAFDHATLFPFQYVYRNEVFRFVPDFQNRFEFDYWQIAGREIARGLDELGPGVVAIRNGRAPNGALSYVDMGPNVIPFLAKDQIPIGQVDSSAVGAGWLYYWPPSVDEVFRTDLDRCSEVRKVATVLWPKTIELGSVYDCR